ncbi:MAG: hypothetical protein U0165_09655 [Polyangiaceae bacterium]
MAGAYGATSFTQLGLDAALDFAVIEMPFAFWQYIGSGACSSIPATSASDDEIWAFVQSVALPEFWLIQVS